MRSLSLTTLLTALHFSQAANVYLSPQPTIDYNILSPKRASNVLSVHLGLEALEPAYKSHSQQQPFIGRGPRNALLLTVNKEDVEVILPSSLQPSFKLSTAYSSSNDSLLSVLPRCLHRASYRFSSTFGGDQLQDLTTLASFFETMESPSFAALEVPKLSSLRQIYGSGSHEYLEAANETRQFLDLMYSKSDTLHMALLVFSASPPSLSPRETHPENLESQSSQSSKGRPLPQEPIGSVSTCFSSKDSCSHGTNSCSGRGRCLKATKAGRTCFVCTCDITRTGKGPNLKTDTWAGQSCERKDISGPFVLLSSTAVVLLVLVFGSVSLLSSVGDKELPSTLLATAVHVKKD